MFREALQKSSARRRALMGAGLLAGMLVGSMAFAQSVSNLSLLDRQMHDGRDIVHVTHGINMWL